MDKELDGLTPSTLSGTTVNTVHTASKEEVAVALAEEKERKEDYYIDPLEQDAAMKEKLAKIESEKPAESSENKGEEREEAVPEIHPDLNVSGFFSAGNTAKRPGFMSHNASISALNLCFVFGIINAIYSAFYLLALISTGFDTNWFFGWLYAVVVVTSIIIAINCFRSRNVQKDELKRKALIGLVGSAISILPLIGWILHFFTTTLS